LTRVSIFAAGSKTHPTKGFFTRPMALPEVVADLAAIAVDPVILITTWKGCTTFIAGLAHENRHRF
jgi:hypothetical protein